MTATVAYARALCDDPTNREKHDFYPTWPAATRALLSVERFDGPVWEPACGDGAISRELRAAGYDVISTDLIDRGYGEGNRDFLMEWLPLAPNIVTNPPFKLAEEFVERALMLTTGKVAFFLRLAFLEGVTRGRLSQVGDAHGVIAFAWFVWEHGHTGSPALSFLDWKGAAA